MITKEILREISPSAKDSIITDLEKYFDKWLSRSSINTYLRVCHFLAQCAHESDHFKTLEEYASGSAYEGRKDLGNTRQGDGRRFKGRGIIQLTGRANYIEASADLDLDLVNNPELAEDPEVSVRTAIWFWEKRKLNQFADKDDITTITRRINGGFNGFEDRKKYLARAKRVLKDEDFTSFGKSDSEEDDKNIVLAKRGEVSDYVKDIQNLLINKGAKITADGNFGPKTEEAVKDFQRWSNLAATGRVDVATMNALMK
jgi:putative chitinase